MNNITEIIVHTGEEPCNVDVDMLHKTLLNLPAEKYLSLYHIMQRKIIGEPYLGCNCGFADDTAESTV